MGKYIHKFDTVSEFNDYRNENYKQPGLSYTSENDKMDYNEYSAEDYEMLNTPLTFEALEDQTGITFFQSTPAVTDEIPVLEIEISTDDGNTWITKQAVQYNSNGHDIAIIVWLNAGEKVLVRGNNLAYGYYSDSEDTTVSNCGFFADAACYVYGNIMSLIDKNNFSTLREVTDYAFSYLFSDYGEDLDGSGLLSHPNKKLLLPATTLENYCYYCMFYRCTSLTTAPELPATTLATRCYDHMFTGCSNLITAPKLPATTLADYCYNYMFGNCTSLITAPELPATTLVDSCYNGMFSGCTSLTTAPELPVTTLASYCYRCMFQDCTSMTTAPELPATTLATSCYAYMFRNCTSMTTAPELPATTLVDSCYNGMFSGCTSLNYIKAIFTTTPTTSYTSDWVRNVASAGIFIKNINAEWNVTGNNGIPTGGTVGYYPEELQ